MHTGGARYAPRMMTESGTRADLVAKLREMAEGWDHLAKPDNATAAAEGASELATGAASVQVGHTRYVVDESTDTTTER